METLPGLTALISKLGGIPAERVTPDSTPRVLEIDSLTLVELIISAETEFGVTLEDGALLPDHTVAQMAAIIATKQAPRTA